jgi:eukaryotic-like serine/threonine-protein kinase
MSGPTENVRTVRFAEFELDLETAELRTNGATTILAGQPFQVLVALLKRPGQLVTREELKKQLWPSDTFVDFDQSLNKAVNRLREALGDSAESPRFIETLPRKGYRFIGAVSNGVVANTTRLAVPDLAVVVPLDVEKSNGMIERHWWQSLGLRYAIAAAVACLIVALIVITVRLLRSRKPNLANVRITKLTDSGGVTGVAISPDGQYIVYSLTRGADESLHLRQISTGSEVEVVAAGPGFHGLTFSPRGDAIYFVRSDPKEPYLKYLYSVPLLGGQARRLIDDVDSPVTFSPDGRQFAFERAVTRRSVVELRAASSDGSGEHLLATIQNGDSDLFQPGPSWSPDGRTIVSPFRILGKAEVRWILAVVSIPSGAVRELYSGMAAVGRPAWLSEERLLVPRFDAAYERWQLWVMSYPDGKMERFTNDLSDYAPELDAASDRRTVAAVASTAVSNVWEAPAGNLSGAKQVSFGQLPMGAITETSKGRLLSSSSDGRVWTIKPDGQREPFSDLRNVQWIKACGSLILSTTYEANSITLSRASDDEDHFVKLFSGDLSLPGCSPDGKFVFYVSRHRPQKIWRISTAGGSPETIGDGMGEGIFGRLEVSPDGTQVSVPFTRYDPPGWNLAVLPASGGPVMNTLDLPGGTTNVHWSPAGTAFQYLVTQDRATNIWEQSLAGGKPKQLTKFASGLIFDFSWSSDHRRMLLTRGDVTSDVVLLTNVH